MVTKKRNKKMKKFTAFFKIEQKVAKEIKTSNLLDT